MYPVEKLRLLGVWHKVWTNPKPIVHYSYIHGIRQKLFKKKLIKAETYPLEVRKELTSLIWAWIQSSTLNALESNRKKQLHRLNPNERVGNYYYFD